MLGGDDEFAAGAAFLHVGVGLDDLIERVDPADGDAGGAVSDGLQEFLSTLPEGRQLRRCRKGSRTPRGM